MMNQYSEVDVIGIDSSLEGPLFFFIDDYAQLRIKSYSATESAITTEMYIPSNQKTTLKFFSNGSEYDAYFLSRASSYFEVEDVYTSPITFPATEARLYETQYLSMPLPLGISKEDEVLVFAFTLSYNADLESIQMIFQGESANVISTINVTGVPIEPVGTHLHYECDLDSGCLFAIYDASDEELFNVILTNTGNYQISLTEAAGTLGYVTIDESLIVISDNDDSLEKACPTCSCTISYLPHVHTMERVSSDTFTYVPEERIVETDISASSILVSSQTKCNNNSPTVSNARTYSLGQSFDSRVSLPVSVTIPAISVDFSETTVIASAAHTVIGSTDGRRTYDFVFTNSSGVEVGRISILGCVVPEYDENTTVSHLSYLSIWNSEFTSLGLGTDTLSFVILEEVDVFDDDTNITTTTYSDPVAGVILKYSSITESYSYETFVRSCSGDLPSEVSVSLQKRYSWMDAFVCPTYSVLGDGTMSDYGCTVHFSLSMTMGAIIQYSDTIAEVASGWLDTLPSTDVFSVGHYVEVSPIASGCVKDTEGYGGDLIYGTSVDITCSVDSVDTTLYTISLVLYSEEEDASFSVNVTGNDLTSASCESILDGIEYTLTAEERISQWVFGVYPSPHDRTKDFGLFFTLSQLGVVEIFVNDDSTYRNGHTAVVPMTNISIQFNDSNLYESDTNNANSLFQHSGGSMRYVFSSYYSDSNNSDSCYMDIVSSSNVVENECSKVSCYAAPWPSEHIPVDLIYYELLVNGSGLCATDDADVSGCYEFLSPIPVASVSSSETSATHMYCVVETDDLGNMTSISLVFTKEDTPLIQVEMAAGFRSAPDVVFYSHTVRNEKDFFFMTANYGSDDKPSISTSISEHGLISVFVSTDISFDYKWRLITLGSNVNVSLFDYESKTILGLVQTSKTSFQTDFAPITACELTSSPIFIANFKECSGLSCEHGVCASDGASCSCSDHHSIDMTTQQCSDFVPFVDFFIVNDHQIMSFRTLQEYTELLVEHGASLDITSTFPSGYAVFIRAMDGVSVRLAHDSDVSDSYLQGLLDTEQSVLTANTMMTDIKIGIYENPTDLFFVRYYSSFNDGLATLMDIPITSFVDLDSSDFSSSVTTMTCSFVDDDELCSFSLNVPIQIPSDDDSLVRKTRALSIAPHITYLEVSSVLGSVELGFDFYDDDDVLIHSFLLDGLMDLEDYEEIDQFYLLQNKTPNQLGLSDYADLFGGGDYMDIPGHWGFLGSVSDDDSTLRDDLMIIYVSVFGKHLMFVSLNNIDDSVACIKMQPNIRSPTILDTDIHNMSDIGIIGSDGNGLAKPVAYKFEPKLSTSNPATLGLIEPKHFCDHGTESSDFTEDSDLSEMCSCYPSYSGYSCHQPNCTLPSNLFQCISFGGEYIPYCDEYLNMFQPEDETTIIDGSDGPYCGARIRSDVALSIRGGDLSEGPIYVHPSTTVSLIGLDHTDVTPDTYPDTVQIIDFKPIYPYDDGILSQTLTLITYPDGGYELTSDSFTDSLDLPDEIDGNILEPGETLDIPIPLPFYDNIVRHIQVVEETYDICFVNFWDDIEISDAECDYGITGILGNEDLTGRTVVIRYSMDMGTVQSLLLFFYITDNTTSDVVMIAKLRICMYGLIEITYDSGRSSTTESVVSVEFLEEPIASSDSTLHTGTSIRFDPILADDFPVNKISLECVHGEIYEYDGSASCVCEERWRGDACDICTLAYWGDELAGCMTPNCRDRCNDSHCIAVTHDAAVCGCVDGNDTWDDLTVPASLSRTIYSSTTASEDELAYTTFMLPKNVCAVEVEPNGTGIMVDVTSLSAILSPAASLSLSGTVFKVFDQTYYTSELLKNSTERSALSAAYNADIWWVNQGADGLINTHSTCLISHPGGYNAVDAGLGLNRGRSLEWTCEDSYSDRFVDTESIPIRNANVSSFLSELDSFSSNECGEGQTSCILDLPVWAVPLYGHVIYSIQIYVGSIILLNSDGEEVGNLVPINEEVSSDFTVFFDDKDTDDECSCCGHRIVIETSVDTLSFSVNVQVSFYRDGRISLDYDLAEVVDIDGKVRPALEVTGRATPDFPLPTYEELMDYASNSGCDTWDEENDDPPGVQFSTSLSTSQQSSTLSIRAEICEPPCAFGTCDEDSDGSDKCSCSVRFTGDLCDTCIGGWETSGDDSDTFCDSATCSFFSECSSHGVCSGELLTGVQQCECDDGYVGDDCATATPTVECDPECENGGICFAGVCFCPDGFTGDECEDLSCDDGCSEDISGGECDGSTGLCVCNEDFSGDDCSVYTPDGSCKYGVSNGSGCTCQLGYSGDFCQCKSNCSSHGLCRVWGCECDDGYSGDDCSEEAVPLLSDKISVDFDEGSITIYFDTPVTLSGVSNDVRTIDCSDVVEPEFYGTCTDSEGNDSYRVINDLSMCKKSKDGTSLTIFP
ncbi:hypothetical protein ADUPG1_008379, partial [Aduncisulcus paluster]